MREGRSVLSPSVQALVAPGVSSTTNGWLDEFMEACDAHGCRFPTNFDLDLTLFSNHRIDYFACHSYVLSPKAQIKKLQEFSER